MEIKYKIALQLIMTKYVKMALIIHFQHHIVDLNNENKIELNPSEYKIDFEKSTKLIGNKYIKQRSDTSITNNSAGTIRLIRLS